MAIKVIGNTRIYKRTLSPEEVKANRRFNDFRTEVITKMERIDSKTLRKQQVRIIKGMTTLHSL